MDEVPLFLRIKFNRLRFAFLITGPLLLLSSLSLSPFFLRVLFRIVIHENRASTSQGYILSTWSVLSWLDPSLTFSAFFFFLPLLFLSYHCPPPSSINLFFSLRSSGPRNEQRKSIGWHCGFVPSPVVLRFSLILASAPVVPLMPRSPSRENSISFFFCPTPFLFYKRKKRFVLIDEVTLSSFYPYFCFTAKDFIVISAYSLFRENSRAGSGPRNLFFSFFYDKEELGFLAIDELTLQFVFSKFSLRYLIDGDGNLVTSIKRRIYINIHSKITVYNKFGMTRESRAKSRFTTIGNFTPDSLLMNRKGEQEKGA